MDNQYIKAKMFNDIISEIYKDAYIINQENDINEFNTFKKKGWKYAIDAYSINVNTINYAGSYRFDKKKDKPYNLTPLSFISYSDHSGLDLLNFINKVLDGNPELFVHLDKFNAIDLRKKMFDITEISIKCTNVDAILIYNIKKYFHNLKEIHFYGCNIKSECNFSGIKNDIKFNECNIENIRSFNDVQANINFLRTNINKIVHTTILSKTIEFDCHNQNIYKELFLTCNFPNLENLSVKKDINFVEYSYLNQFIFLPTSAPKIENLFIGGKVSSFDFLREMKNLMRCQIDSIFDVFSNFYPDVDTRKERLKLLKRNEYQYKVKKLLTEYEDKYIIGSLEIERILKASIFNKLLSYDKDELNRLICGGRFNVKEINDGEVTKYYESYYDTLIERNNLNDQDIRLGLEDTIFKIKDYLYIDRVYKTLYSKKILLCKKFIYNSDGKPIIFMHRKKPITTLDGAIEFRKKHPSKGNYMIDDFNRDEYNEFLEIVSNLPENITIGELLDYINERTYYKVTKESFKELGEGGKFLSGIYEKYKRLDKRYDDIIRKNERYYNRLCKIIFDNYDKFTLEEKIYINYDILKYDLSRNIHTTDNEVYNIKELYDSNSIISINEKTYNLYQKYIDMIKMTYNQLYIGEKSYDIDIPKEIIKKINIK